MEKDLSAALVLMAGAIQNLADAQIKITSDTAAIRAELSNQTKTVAKMLEKTRKRSADMLVTAREFSETAADVATASRR